MPTTPPLTASLTPAPASSSNARWNFSAGNSDGAGGVGPRYGRGPATTGRGTGATSTTRFGTGGGRGTGAAPVGYVTRSVCPFEDTITGPSGLTQNGP